ARVRAGVTRRVHVEVRADELCARHPGGDPQEQHRASKILAHPAQKLPLNDSPALPGPTTGAAVTRREPTTIITTPAPSAATPATKVTVLTAENVRPSEAARSPSGEQALFGHSLSTVPLRWMVMMPVAAPAPRLARPSAPTAIPALRRAGEGAAS